MKALPALVLTSYLIERLRAAFLMSWATASGPLTFM